MVMVTDDTACIKKVNFPTRRERDQSNKNNGRDKLMMTAAAYHCVQCGRNSHMFLIYRA